MKPKCDTVVDTTRRGTLATPQKESLRALRAEEQTALERIARASSERMDRVRRAKALLAVGRGAPFAEAARAAGLRSGSTVALLVHRFHEQGVAALAIAAGRGRPPTYDGDARAQVVATAQRPAERRTDGTAPW